MKFHDVEITIPATGPLFRVKVDGVELPNTMGVTVESPMVSHMGATVVTLRIPANVTIKGRVMVNGIPEEEKVGGIQEVAAEEIPGLPGETVKP